MLKNGTQGEVFLISLRCESSSPLKDRYKVCNSIGEGKQIYTHTQKKTQNHNLRLKRRYRVWGNVKKIPKPNRHIKVKMEIK